MFTPTKSFDKEALEMKRYIKEAAIFLLQLLAFYIIPLFVKVLGPMGFVLLIILATLALSTILGVVSKSKIKFLYPIAAAIAFLPSVFIYYNESALVHALWYVVVASIGLFFGTVISILLSKPKKD